jgi:hypothetical protein
MAGIGLFNFDIDAKSVEPIAIIAVAGVAGYFLYVHLQARNTATSQAAATNAAEAPVQSELGGLEQLALLQELTGQAATVTTGGSATGAATVQPTASQTASGATASQTASGATNTSSTVGIAPQGTV